MLFAVVNECVSCCSHSFRQDESNFVGTAEVIYFDQVLNAGKVLSVANHVIVFVVLNCQLVNY